VTQNGASASGNGAPEGRYVRGLASTRGTLREMMCRISPDQLAAQLKADAEALEIIVAEYRSHRKAIAMPPFASLSDGTRGLAWVTSTRD
jgi:hypothetical protein